MKQGIFFNPFDKNHITLLQFLEGKVGTKEDHMSFVNFGNKTQHLFRNGAYVMSINWNLV